MRRLDGMRAREIARSTLALVAVLTLVHSGCTSSVDPRLVHLPPPPSEKLRSQFGAVRLTAGGSDAAMLFASPPKGAGEGAARGARIAFLAFLGVGSRPGVEALVPQKQVAVAPFVSVSSYDAANLVIIALAPVAAVVGGVFGAIVADPAAKVEAQEAVIRTAMRELTIQETFRTCVSTAVREQAPHVALTSSEAESAPTVLEVTVEQVGLYGAETALKPPLRFIMTERTRVIRSSDGAEVYAHWLTWRGQTRPLDAWVAQEGRLLKEEAGRACRDLAERLVDEVYLVYLPGAER